MTEFHFLRPEWLWGLSVLLLLPFLAGKGRSNGGLWRDFCDRILLRPQLVAGTGAKTFVPAVLAGACWILAVLSLAGPAWERLPQPAVKKGVDTVYLLDISVFMTPSDVKPSRMDRARFKLHDFLQKAKDGQSALVLYDNEPFVAVPLTQDVRVIDQMLPSVQAGMMGGRTPDAAKALDQARALLKQAGSARGRVVMIGAHVSGGNQAAARKAAERLRSDGYTVSVSGVGTGRGAPLQMPDGTFLKSGGKPVLSALTADNLEKIAVSGGGIYRAAGLDDADVDAIAGVAADAGGVSGGSDTDVKADAWRDFGAVLCWLILPFAALGYRKGWLGVLLLALTPVQARADVSDLWTRSERKEALHIMSGEKPADANVFSDRGWRGVALYKSGDFQSAAAALGDPDDAETRYNLGNALAQAGQYRQAIEAYKKVRTGRKTKISSRPSLNLNKIKKGGNRRKVNRNGTDNGKISRNPNLPTTRGNRKINRNPSASGRRTGTNKSVKTGNPRRRDKKPIRTSVKSANKCSGSVLFRTTRRGCCAKGSGGAT